MMAASPAASVVLKQIKMCILLHLLLQSIAVATNGLQVQCIGSSSLFFQLQVCTELVGVLLVVCTKELEEVPMD